MGGERRGPGRRVPGGGDVDAGAAPHDPLVSVVVVTWNSSTVVEGCLSSLRDTIAPLPWDVTVVDNGSTDSTPGKVRAIAPEARLIENETNRGLAAANNQGISGTRGRYVLICNPDVIFRPGAISAMVDLLERRPRCGWVVARLVYEDGAIQTSAGDLPTIKDALLGRQADRRRQPGIRAGFWWDGWSHDEEVQVGRGHEAAYMVRRVAVDEVGLQDERYVLDWEGIDWTERFRRAGWETWFAPDAEVVHLGGDSIRQVPIRWIVSQHRGMYRYFSDRRPALWKPILAAAFGARAAAKAGATVVGLPMYQWAHRDRRDRT